MYSINFSTVDKRKRQKVTELNKFRTRPKKGVLFPEIDRVKVFYHSPTCIFKCVSSLLSKNKQTSQKNKNKARIQKSKRN